MSCENEPKSHELWANWELNIGNSFLVVSHKEQQEFQWESSSFTTSHVLRDVESVNILN